MSNFVSDIFTGTSGTSLSAHTGETGATWVYNTQFSAGPIVLTDAGRVRSAQSSVSWGVASGTPGSADYSVYADLTVKSLIGDVGVAGRTATSGFTGYWLDYDATSGQWNIKLLNGSSTILGSYAQTLTVGSTYAVELRMAGTSLKAFIDGVERISVTNATLSTAGLAGIITVGDTTNTTGLHLDNFAAGDAGSPGHATPATGYSLSGPTSGTVGVASTNFTVVLTPSGGTVTGTATITPSDGGAGGTFTPSTVGLTTAAPSATFTYTPSVVGVATISTTNNASLANPSSQGYNAQAVTSNLKILFIGDSITAGTVAGSDNAPSVSAKTLLETLHGSRAVTVVNAAVSGTTSADWIASSTNLTNAKASAVTTLGTPNTGTNPVWASVMLGTNDSKTSVATSKASYKANILSLASNLLAAGYSGVIVHYSPYVADGALSSWDIGISAPLLSAYQDAICELAISSSGLLGDDTAYILFAANPSWLSDGVHPDAAHSLLLGQIQGEAIYRAVTSGLSGSSGRRLLAGLMSGGSL